MSYEEQSSNSGYSEEPSFFKQKMDEAISIVARNLTKLNGGKKDDTR